MITPAISERYSARFGREQSALVALMFAYSVMSYFDRTIMSIAGPEIMKEFGVAPERMGWVYSSAILSYALFMVPGGDLADRLGPRKTLLLMGLSAALFTALTPFGGHPALAFLGVVPVLIVIRFAFGAVSSPIYTACARMCAAWIPTHYLARVQAFIIAGACMGGAVSPIVFKWLISLFRWRNSFYLAGAATALLALLWFLYVRRLPRDAERVTGLLAQPRSWRRLLLNRNLALLTFAYFTLGYFEYIFFYWIYYYFGEVRHTGFTQSARYTTVIFLVMLVMMPMGGWVSDILTRLYGHKFGRRVVPIVGLSAGAVLLYAGVNAPTTDASAVLFAVAIGFVSTCEGPFWSTTIDIGGSQVGAAGGILNAGGNIGGFFSPVLVPLVAKYAGWSWGLYTGSILVILGAIACLFIDASKEVPRAPAANPAIT